MIRGDADAPSRNIHCDMPSSSATNPRALRVLFASYGLGPENQPCGDQATLLIALLGVYGRHGLLPSGKPQPLCAVCPRARLCWAKQPPESRRVGDDIDGEDGSICLPWVGEDYRRGGVCVLAMNFNIGPHDPTNLMIGFDIVLRQYLPALRAGRRAIGGSRVLSGIARTAAALLDVLDGKPVIDREAVQLADTYARIAQLQAVKCIPIKERSVPSPTMWRECSQLLLGEELDVLKPSMLVALGTESQRVVERLEGYDPFTGPDPSIGTLRRGDYALTAYGVAHPAFHGAYESETQLLEELRRANPPETGVTRKPQPGLEAGQLL